MVRVEIPYAAVVALDKKPLCSSGFHAAFEPGLNSVPA